jgi:hypothetical protein
MKLTISNFDFVWNLGATCSRPQRQEMKSVGQGFRPHKVSHPRLSVFWRDRVGDAGMKLTISNFDLFGILVRLVPAVLPV